MRALALAAALAALPAAAQTPAAPGTAAPPKAAPPKAAPKPGGMMNLNVYGELPDTLAAFREICLAAPASTARQRELIRSNRRKFERAPSSVESYVRWPVQVSIVDAEGFANCFVASPVAPRTTMADALKLVRPVLADAGGAPQERIEGELVTWRRVLAGVPQEVRLNLSHTPAGATAIFSVAAKKPG